MRPVRLELKGFTAFREQQEVDFEGLDLFAVSGQTGSGKSSLLDAMTYALFGYVERVGKQVGQLVSQGQPRMAVSLEFEVGAERFRVTRSTPAARGATKILLERHEGGEWRQAGDGADRVREADQLLRQAVGLDYEAFTRSVLLPQGRFAEFLVGEAKERRAILTELLGLELFERLARRAGELKRTAGVQVEATEGLLATEYAGVDERAAAAAEALAEAASGRDGALAAAEEKVRGVAARWARAEEDVRALGERAVEARAAAGTAAAAAEESTGLAQRLAGAEAAAKDATRRAAGASRVLQRSAGGRAKAEERWGRATDLAALRARAEGLVAHREEIAEALRALADARAELPRLEAAAADADAAVAEASSAREGAEDDVRAARAAHDAAVHADLVAAVRGGLRKGEPCPVCGATVESIPRSAKTAGIERARAAVSKAARTEAAAEKVLRTAERRRDGAESSREDLRRRIDQLAREVEKRREELSGVETELAKTMGGRLPADPVAALGERIARLEELAGAERGAAVAMAEADRAAVESERDRDALVAEAETARVRLEGLRVDELLARARRRAGEDVLPATLPSLPPARAAAREVARVAGELAARLEELAGALDGLAGQRAGAEPELLAEAAAAVEGLVEVPGTVAGLVGAVAEARRAAAAEAATAAREAELLRERLEKARVLVAELSEHGARARRFGALAQELRADRLIAFLQFEALQVLAAAGSEHLGTLSAGRYRLHYEGDEFYVVDTWNGEEMRSARTLSGGETFLASLGLALALSEQVRSLAVTERATLDSLFLDEGFGTLDPESLETVVEAIEQLGGDGRMVGVITHVQELALRLPVRIEVEKSPRGSSVTMVR